MSFAQPPGDDGRDRPLPRPRRGRHDVQTPAKRSKDATSARTRTHELITNRLSSSLTSAVIATETSLFVDRPHGGGGNRRRHGCAAT